MKFDCSNSTNHKDLASGKQSLRKAVIEHKRDLTKPRKIIEDKLKALIKTNPFHYENEVLFISKPPVSNRSRRNNNASISSDQYSFMEAGDVSPVTADKEQFGESYRGSQYRGISKNGKRYQVFIMINKKKEYFGPFEDPSNAAKIYDQIAIIFHGLKVSFII